jgi:hypothetical protein
LTFPVKPVKIKNMLRLREGTVFFLTAIWLCSGFFAFPQNAADWDALSVEGDSGEGEAEETGFFGGTVPLDLLRPQRGEAPRYPQDLLIGVLGRGAAPEGAYLFAQELLAAIVAENQNFPAFSVLNRDVLTDIFQNTKEIKPLKGRLGGGQREADGSVSFLIRFIGREQGISGELYLREEETKWRFEDIILEEPRSLTGIGDGYSFDFSPYERFY